MNSRRILTKSLLLLAIGALIGSGCIPPAQPGTHQAQGNGSVAVATTTTAEALQAEAPLAPATQGPVASATPHAPAETPTPHPTRSIRIQVTSQPPASSVTTRPIVPAPPLPEEQTQAADVPPVSESTQRDSLSAEPVILAGLAFDQRCGHGDIVAADGHQLYATPQLLADNSNFLDWLPEGSRVDLLDCNLWTDATELIWLAVRTPQKKLGWMLIQPDKFYITLHPVILELPSRSLTGIPAGAGVAYVPPSDCANESVSTEAVATSIGVDLIPVIGDMKGLGEAATGCDLVTGESLGDWRWLGLLGIIGMSELMLLRHTDSVVAGARAGGVMADGGRHVDDIPIAFGRNADGSLRILGKLDGVLDEGTDAVRVLESSRGVPEEVLRTLSKFEQPCSFSAETPVLTQEGLQPISEIVPGQLVRAYHEGLGVTAYYTVTAAFNHVDVDILLLTLGDEVIVTTPEHPFRVGGVWIPAALLQPGDEIRTASGTDVELRRIQWRRSPQTMYNLTVAEAHTYFVGNGGWLVHNACSRKLRGNLTVPKEWDENGVAWQAHHVIPGQFEREHPVIIRAGDKWDIDGAANGVALPSSDAQVLTLCNEKQIRSMCLPLHRGSHPNYSREVEAQLDDLNRVADLEDWSAEKTAVELNKLADRLRTHILARPTGQRLD